jgi:short-subunit dehydrogenase
MNLSKKHILLTGATGGLGVCIALKLAEKNVVLALVGRDTHKLHLLQKQLASVGCNSHCIVADLSEQGAGQKIVDAAKRTLGHIDILINNAGVLDFIELQNQSETRIAEMINTNVTSLILATRALLPDLLSQNQGHLLFVGSVFGSLAFPHYATYCASKFAVHGFSQALRRELVNTNIGVTYIAPRGIKTPMNDANTSAMLKKSGTVLDSPEKVANIIVKALEQERQEVFIGQPESIFAWLNGIFPRLINLGLKKQTALALAFLKSK